MVHNITNLPPVSRTSDTVQGGMGLQLKLFKQDEFKMEEVQRRATKIIRRIESLLSRKKKTNTTNEKHKQNQTTTTKPNPKQQIQNLLLDKPFWLQLSWVQICMYDAYVLSNPFLSKTLQQ